MDEIPAQKKKRRVPLWVWPLASAVLGIGGVLLVMGLLPSAPVAVPPKRCAAEVECAERELCLVGACVPITPGLPECLIPEVHFDTNSAKILAADEPKLERMARCLKGGALPKLRIAGSADERGTDSYNEELGERRAMAVARYLQERGVSGEQLKIVSYGDDRPLCLTSDKDCWAKNRRASLTPQ